MIGTGRAEIDACLGGGIASGSLVLVEGRHATGKSVLCQHLAYTALSAGLGVAYYTTEEASPSLLTRGASLGLDMLDHFLLDRLRIHSLEGTGARSGPSSALSLLTRHMETLPTEFTVVVVDSLSTVSPYPPVEPILSFLDYCRRLCSLGKTVVLVLDSRPGLDSALARLPQEPDVRLRLNIAAVHLRRMERVVRTLDVERRDQHPEWPSPLVAFEVEAGYGIRVVPWRQFRLPDVPSQPAN